MKSEFPEDRYLDLPRLSEYSSLGVGTLREHCKNNGLPHYRVRGKILVKRSEFDGWMEKKWRSEAVNLDVIADETVCRVKRRI